MPFSETTIGSPTATLYWGGGQGWLSRLGPTTADWEPSTKPDEPGISPEEVAAQRKRDRKLRKKSLRKPLLR